MSASNSWSPLPLLQLLREYRQNGFVQYGVSGKSPAGRTVNELVGCGYGQTAQRLKQKKGQVQYVSRRNRIAGIAF